MRSGERTYRRENDSKSEGAVSKILIVVQRKRCSALSQLGRGRGDLRGKEGAPKRQSLPELTKRTHWIQLLPSQWGKKALLFRSDYQD